MNIQKSQNLFVNWEKVGKYLRTTLKNPNFESMDQLGKVIHISDIMRYFITLVNLEKCFPFGTFEPIENSAHTTEFLALRKTLNIYIDR